MEEKKEEKRTVDHEKRKGERQMKLLVTNDDRMVCGNCQHDLDYSQQGSEIVGTTGETEETCSVCDNEHLPECDNPACRKIQGYLNPHGSFEFCDDCISWADDLIYSEFLSVRQCSFEVVLSDFIVYELYTKDGKPNGFHVTEVRSFDALPEIVKRSKFVRGFRQKYHADTYAKECNMGCYKK